MAGYVPTTLTLPSSGNMRTARAAIMVVISRFGPSGVVPYSLPSPIMTVPSSV